jgi:hypothetical protein
MLHLLLLVLLLMAELFLKYCLDALLRLLPCMHGCLLACSCSTAAAAAAADMPAPLTVFTRTSASRCVVTNVHGCFESAWPA